MPMSRFSGAVCVRSTPSNRIWPSAGNSNPAMQRSVVVLPQPEGPSSDTNSPFATVRSIAFNTSKFPKRFRTALRRSSDIAPNPS